MAYRGHDLDLRLGRPAAIRSTAALSDGTATEAGHRLATRDGTIAVDETLMATCNHAFEAAIFHGSREVRLEHLVYALARVGAAAQILDDLGIRPERLRREAALAIAAETPAAAADAKVDPLASEEFETVLRHASERAHERGILAGVPDLLRTILSAGRDNPTVSLLSRSSSDPQRLERWREESLRREREPAVDMVHAAQVPDQSAAILARIEQLEAALQLSTEEVMNYRRSTHEALRQMQDGLHALMSVKPLPPLPDRTDELKSLVDGRLHDLSELVLSLDERLHGLSKIQPVVQPLADDMVLRLERLEQRIAENGRDIERTLTPALSERLSQLVGERLASHLGSTEAKVSELMALVPSSPPATTPDVTASLLQLDSTVREQIASSATAPVQEKLGQLEVALKSHLMGAEELAKTHERDLSEIYEALVKLGANQQTLANNLNTWRLDTSGDVSIVSNRLEALETTVLESLGRISAELQMLRGAPHPDEQEPQREGWSFKRWLFGTTRVLTPSLHREGPSPVRHALTRLRLVKK